jgi:hypothetical protein
MRRLSGAALLLGAALCTYFFATRAMFYGRGSLGPEYSPLAPFGALGLDYPADGLLLAGAAWGLVLGLYLVLTGSEEISKLLKGGRIARLSLLNALLLLSTLGIACLGTRAPQAAASVNVFALVAALQILLGLLLVILALFERPKGFVSLVVGTLVYAGGVTLGVLAFLWGGA